MGTHRKRLLGIVATAATVALAVTGCSGAHDAKSGSASSAALPADASHAPDNAPGSASPTHPIDLAVAKRPVSDRQVISTAQLDVESRDIDQTVERATTLVLDAQGFVFAESASLTSRQHAHVVFKVPPERFADTLTRIGRLATLVHRRIGTQDVTGRVVDLNARLGAARTSAERLRQLLANSGGVADLLNVEQQLTAREGEVDSLAGELAALRAQIDMATITLDVSPRAARPAATRHEGPGFTRGLRAGARAFAATARVVEAGVGIALPFVPVGLLALAGWGLVRRRGAAGAAAP